MVSVVSNSTEIKLLGILNYFSEDDTTVPEGGGNVFDFIWRHAVDCRL